MSQLYRYKVQTAAIEGNKTGKSDAQLYLELQVAVNNSRAALARSMSNAGYRALSAFVLGFKTGIKIIPLPQDRANSHEQVRSYCVTACPSKRHLVGWPVNVL